MANSSEWLGTLAEAARPAPGWLALLGEPAEFREAFAFDAFEPEALPPDASGVAPEPPPPDPAEDALARAYAQGEAAGRAAALAEAEAVAANQRALRLGFRALDEAALQVLADDLAATVMALCDGVLAGYATDRDALLARCHAAAARIGGVAASALALHLHPDDIALVGDDALTGWRIHPDPALERGVVVLEGPDGSVSDGPTEWRRAIAAAVRG